MFRIFIPIILITTAGLIGFLYIKPLYIESVTAFEYNRDIKDSLQKNKEIEKVVTSLQTDISSIPQSNLDKLKIMLPNNIDKIRLLNDLNTIALRRGISLKDLKVNKRKSNVLDKKKNTTFNTLSIRFSASSSSYSDFKLFLKDIEKSMKLMDINSILFSVLGPTSANLDGSYSYEVNFNTYWIE